VGGNELYIDPNFSQVNTVSTTYYIETDGTLTTLPNIFRYTSLTSEVFYYKLKVSGIEFNRIIVSNGTSNVNINATTFENSFLVTMLDDNLVNFFGFGISQIGTLFNINPYAINLTALGIASQTQAQMDAYFQAWQRNNAGTLLANTFIQHDQNSVPIADLNGKTLDEVFIGGQLISNPDFNNGTTDWITQNGSINTVENGILKNQSDGTSTVPNFRQDSQDFAFDSGVQVYAISRLRAVGGTQTSIQLQVRTTTVQTFAQINTPTLNEWYSLSGIITSTGLFTGTRYIRVIHNYTTASTNNSIEVDYVYAINLTALGITATQAQLDFWYSVWQQNHKLGMRVHRASGNDLPLAVLNGQSLNQVFVGGQLLTNPDFDNGTTNVIKAAALSLSVSNSIATTQHVSGNLDGWVGLSYIVSGSNEYYQATRYKMDGLGSFNVAFWTGSAWTTLLPRQAGQWYNETLKFTANFVSFGALVRFDDYIPNQPVFTDYIYLYNLTSLGISTLTKSQLDYLFTVWQFNNLNALVARQFIQEA
jgi:hypothetical protein